MAGRSTQVITNYPVHKKAPHGGELFVIVLKLFRHTLDFFVHKCYTDSGIETFPHYVF